MEKKKYIRKKKTAKTLSKVGHGRTIRSVFLSHNFSDIEDNIKAFQIIRNIAAHAGTNAALEAKVAGLSRAYIRNNQNLVKVSPEGVEVALAPKTVRSSFYVKFEPYTVFHAVKK